MRTFYFVFFLVLPVQVFAYLDPGTGSLLLYALVGIIASFIFMLRNLLYRIRELFFTRNSINSGQSTSMDIVFHSEGRRYWPVFEPILHALDSMKICAVYVTPDTQDPAIEWARSHQYINVVNPGNEYMTIAWMNRLRARVVVSTTPNLDVYMWKRSPGVERYIHIFHAPTTVEFYEKYALSFYDEILTVGSFQEKGIIELDERRNLPQKEFNIVGLTYYDYMLREIDRMKNRERPKRVTTGRASILYAPSWGNRSSFVLFGCVLIRRLLDEGYRVILRPHPQSFISDAHIVSEITRLFSSRSNFSIDRNLTGIEAMAESDFMITDFSGVLFDYAYLFGKPIILAVPPEPVVGGYEAEDIDGSLWDVVSAQRLSRPLPENLEELPALIDDILQNLENVSEEYKQFRDETVKNFGCAGQAVAEYLTKCTGENR